MTAPEEGRDVKARTPVRSCGAVLLACTLLGLAGQLTSAGKCAEPGTPKQELARVDAVFLRKVKSV
jgi:hypothetical protein